MKISCFYERLFHVKNMLKSPTKSNLLTILWSWNVFEY